MEPGYSDSEAVKRIPSSHCCEGVCRPHSPSFATYGVNNSWKNRLHNLFLFSIPSFHATINSLSKLSIYIVYALEALADYN